MAEVAGPNPAEPICFCNSFEDKTQQWARMLIRRYGRLIDQDIHPHRFRRYAINMVRLGCDIRRLQQLLGHSNIDTTRLPTI